MFGFWMNVSEVPERKDLGRESRHEGMFFQDFPLLRTEVMGGEKNDLYRLRGSGSNPVPM